MPASADNVALHLTPAAWFHSAHSTGSYLPEAYAVDGFIHLTHGVERVLEVGNLFYRAEPGPWLLLVVDLSRVRAEVRYDDPERVFPHVYGPLGRGAIVAIHTMERDSDGRFTGIGPAMSET